MTPQGREVEPRLATSAEPGGFRPGLKRDGRALGNHRKASRCAHGTFQLSLKDKTSGQGAESPVPQSLSHTLTPNWKGLETEVEGLFSNSESTGW